MLNFIRQKLGRHKISGEELFASLQIGRTVYLVGSASGKIFERTVKNAYKENRDIFLVTDDGWVSNAKAKYGKTLFFDKASAENAAAIIIRSNWRNSPTYTTLLKGN